MVKMRTKKIFIINDISELVKINTCIEEIFNEWELPLKNKLKILLAVEEIFVNIVNYAYDDDLKHKIDVVFSYKQKLLTINISDKGKAFDPVIYDASWNISRPVEEKEPGGIGIHMVKSVMTEVRYIRQNDQNIVTLKKLL